MAKPEIALIPCLSDNYAILVHDAQSGETAAVDTPDPDAILTALAERGWTLSAIWNTHWHPDHTGGNEALKTATGCTVYGPAGERERIPGIDTALSGGDTLALGAHAVEVIATPGHTLGHIVYHMPDDALAFVGDTLFVLGCGRLFEGTPEQMWASLSALAALPDETKVYCAHEYTLANARFARSLDPESTELHTYTLMAQTLREMGEPTVPTSLGREKKLNPFLRAKHTGMQAAMGHPGDPVATFAEIRRRKDNF